MKLLIIVLALLPAFAHADLIDDAMQLCEEHTDLPCETFYFEYAELPEGREAMAFKTVDGRYGVLFSPKLFTEDNYERITAHELGHLTLWVNGSTYAKHGKSFRVACSPIAESIGTPVRKACYRGH